MAITWEDKNDYQVSESEVVIKLTQVPETNAGSIMGWKGEGEVKGVPVKVEILGLASKRTVQIGAMNGLTIGSELLGKVTRRSVATNRYIYAIKDWEPKPHES